MASVVVVGAGLAGLTCAWRLQRAGHDVEVLERDVEVGGRVRSGVVGDFNLEYGSPWLTPAGPNLDAVIRALDLQDALRSVAHRGDAVLRSGRLRSVDPPRLSGLFRTDSLSADTRRRLAQLPLLLLRHRRRLDTQHPERAGGLDSEDFRAGALRVLGTDGAEALGALFATHLPVDVAHLSWTFALVLLRTLASGGTPRRIEGGNGRLARELAARVPVRCGCDVVEVLTQTDGARVRYRSRGRERSVIADAVVMALPGSEVVLRCPKLTPVERGFLEGVRYRPGIVAHLLFDRAPGNLTLSRVVFPASEGLDVADFSVEWDEAAMAPPGAAQLRARFGAAASEGIWEAPDASIADRVLEDLAPTPIGTLRPTGFVVHRWPRMLPCFNTGSLPRLALFLNRAERSPRLAFAGDYLVAPTVEGAVTSGMRAATVISREWYPGSGGA